MCTFIFACNYGLQSMKCAIYIIIVVIIVVIMTDGNKDVLEFEFK